MSGYNEQQDHFSGRGGFLGGSLADQVAQLRGQGLDLSQQDCANTAPKRTSEIHERLTVLEKHASVLLDQVDLLTEKLSPVLLSHPQSGEANSTAPGPPETPLSSVLCSIAQRLEVVSRKLSVLHAAVDF